MPQDDPTKLRDFIYLDVERVKSLLAQLQQGLLTDRSLESGESKSVEGHGGINLPILANVGGSGQYMWTNQERETRTLHDHIFSEAEAALVARDQLIRLPEDFDSSSLSAASIRSELPPVAYVVARGRPIISDYESLAALFSGFNDLAKDITLLGKMEELKGTTGKERSQIQTLIDHEAKAMQIDPSALKSLQRVLAQFYGDRIVIKVLPFDNTNVRIVGPLRREWLRDNLEDIRFKYGMAPRDSWTLFGQIASVPSSKDEPVPLNMYFSNQIEEGITKMFTAVREIERFFGVAYPEIAVTPIAVFRD